MSVEAHRGFEDPRREVPASLPMLALVDVVARAGPHHGVIAGDDKSFEGIDLRRPLGEVLVAA